LNAKTSDKTMEMWKHPMCIIVQQFNLDMVKSPSPSHQNECIDGKKKMVTKIQKFGDQGIAKGLASITSYN
jgi:hypothetical protein